MAFRWQTIEGDSQMALFDTPSAAEQRRGIGEFEDIEFLHVRTKKIINEIPNNTPAPFHHTINPYRGCSHACTYCFARPTHAYLDLDIGNDFDTKIVVKVNAVERLVAELDPKRWKGDGIALGTNTDPYQRAEGKYRLTRGIIETLTRARNPFSILTKSTLVTRDLDVLVEANKRTSVQVDFSIPTLDSDVWRSTEPGTPHPELRVRALAKLAGAGLDCGVLMAPIIPSLSDSTEQMKRVVDACLDAGATSVAASPLHLKPGLRGHWFEWLATAHPGLVPEHQELYENGSYVEARRRIEVASRCRSLAAAHRRRIGRTA